MNPNLQTLQGLPALPLLPAQVEPVAELEQCSDPADLASLACSTHKESSTAQRQLAKSAGMLCVCLSEGLILHMQEIYGCESLSQRYFCVAAVKALLPTLTTVVHDDGTSIARVEQRTLKLRRSWRHLT